VKVRARFLTAGKNKGKSPILTKFQEVTKTVRNEILLLVKKHLGPNLEPPSGKSWADVKATAKLSWWEKWSLERQRSKGKVMPPAWAEPNWEFPCLWPIPRWSQGG